MKISITRDGGEDYITWSNDRTILKRINRMIEEAARDPAPGIGTPQRLSPSLSGSWSRRITDEHRLDDQLRNNELIIVQIDTTTVAATDRYAEPPPARTYSHTPVPRMHMGRPVHSSVGLTWHNPNTPVLVEGQRLRSNP